eukprot:s97_g32.t1
MKPAMAKPTSRAESFSVQGRDDSWELCDMNTARRPVLPVSMLVHSLAFLPIPEKPEEVDADDADPEPWTTSEFEEAEKLDAPGSPGMENLDTDLPDTPPEPSPPSKSSNFFCSSFDSRVIRADLPEHVPRAPNARTHQLYVQYLDRYLQDMQVNKRGFRFAVLRRRRRDFLGDSFQGRCCQGYAVSPHVGTLNMSYRR